MFTAICGTRLLAECLIVAAINWIRYGFLDGLLKISIASRMEQPPALAGEYCVVWKRTANRMIKLLSTTA